MSWQANALMYWSLDGTTWNKVTDHNRQSLQVSVERGENSTRMWDGTLRRQSIFKKRTWTTSWQNLPSKTAGTYNGKTGISTADGGWAGEDIETFHNAHDGEFFVKLRKGTDEAKAISDGTIEVVTVMITDFSKEIVKRGVIDLWNVDITFSEV